MKSDTRIDMIQIWSDLDPLVRNFMGMTHANIKWMISGITPLGIDVIIKEYIPRSKVVLNHSFFVKWDDITPSKVSG